VLWSRTGLGQNPSTAAAISCKNCGDECLQAVVLWTLLNVEHSSAHGSDHDSALQDVSTRVQLLCHLGQIRADLLRIGGEFFRAAAKTK
jgi:hypothetical protein